MNATTEASRVQNSDALDKGIRIGLLSYATTHLIIAVTALPLAWGGGSSGSASQSGAFAHLAQNPVGKASLFVIALGFFAMTIWQGLEAATGHRDEDGKKRVFKRVASGGKAVIYIGLAYSALKVALGSSGGGSGTDSFTAKLMNAPAGQALVGLVGVGVICTGGYLAYKGWNEKFTKHLDGEATSGDTGTALVTLGKVGYIAKGASLAVIGVLFVAAAVTHEADKSGGLDVALHKLAQQPFGPVLLTLVALGIGCFGAYCIGWARHLRR